MLIAEVLSWFDLIAIQEVNDDLRGLRVIQAHLPASWRLLFSDAAGNHERLAFAYDTSQLAVGEEIGEVTRPTSRAWKLENGGGRLGSHVAIPRSTL